MTAGDKETEASRQGDDGCNDTPEGQRSTNKKKSCFCNQCPLFGHQGVHLENLTSACFERWDCLFQGKFADLNITGLVPRGKLLKTAKYFYFIYLFTLGPFKQISRMSKVLIWTSVLSPCFYSKTMLPRTS